MKKPNPGRKKEMLLASFYTTGLPYANGHIHIGHALNKVLKDTHSQVQDHAEGYYTLFVPGWDTHGLPTELQAIKTLGVNRHEVPSLEFRRSCRDFALKFVEIQKEEFKRLGRWGDWENPYLTLAPEYEARQVEVFGTMAQKATSTRERNQSTGVPTVKQHWQRQK